MVGERRSRRQGDSDRHCQGQQRTASARASSNHQDRSILVWDSTERSEGGFVPTGKAETLTRQRAFVSYAVNCWLNWGRARPQIDWDGPTPTIELTTGGILPMYADRLSGALGLQLAYAVASSEGVATCFACGRFYTPARRPAAGRRSFCPACGLRPAGGVAHVETSGPWHA
jgi:hypothetical protein